MSVTTLALGMRGDAVFSADHLHRLMLTREWDDRLPRLSFGMLNPSDAGADRNDPTIRRCIGFAIAWGFGSIEVINLLTYIDSDPDRMAAVVDAIAPENVYHWQMAARRAHKFVCAWGVPPKIVRTRHRHAIYQQIRETGAQRLSCLGVTAEGHPRHPLYLPKTTMLQSWDFNSEWWERAA